MAKIVEVRNNTVEFLTFVAANKEEACRRCIKMTLSGRLRRRWGELFGCSSDNIGVHLKKDLYIVHAEGRSMEPKIYDGDDDWHHTRVVLSPMNPEFQQIVIESEKAGEGDFQIYGELVQVIRQ